MARSRLPKRLRNLPRPPVASSATVAPALITSAHPPATSSQTAGTGLPAGPPPTGPPPAGPPPTSPPPPLSPLLETGPVPQQPPSELTEEDFELFMAPPQSASGAQTAADTAGQAAEKWNITRYPEYRLHHDELAWIGRHSGYWFKYPNSEGGPEYQRRMIQKFNADGNPDRYRIGKLQSLTVSVHAPGYLTTDVDEWFEDQGIALCYQDEDESDTDSE
ncbi:MAG: hypothetical protein J3Q66DRAFT_423487 [Benniella sp.]|nr:MAG: hypothetical protein J3Q66DRAFT_423487 [Benniella sp.]